MLSIILIGVGLTAATVVLHATGTLLWIELMKRNGACPPEESAAPQSQRVGTRRALWILGYTTTILALLHVLEVSVWAFAYLAIPQVTMQGGAEEAFYFSIVTFTSLGYGDVVIDSPWRILSGLEAMAGMLVFGWSSALLLTALIRMLDLDANSTDSPKQA